MRKKPLWRNNKKGLRKQRCQGYYVSKKTKGTPRRFRLKDTLKSKIKHDFDSPSAAMQLGWHIDRPVKAARVRRKK